MAAAGGSGQGIRGSGGSQEQAEVTRPQSASGTGVGTVSPRSGETRASGGSQEQAEVTRPQSASGTGVGTVSPRSGETRASGDGPAQQLIEAVRKSQEEIPDMGVDELLAYQERLRALRLLVLQRIKQEEEKEQATAAPEPRRAG